MSTLTSAQLHVKRSSTRLHAPPGGASSLSFGCGGLGTAEPAEQDPGKDDPVYSRPKSNNRYTPPTTSFSDNNNNAPGGYPGYSSTQSEPLSYNNFAPLQQSYQQQPQPYQYQAPYHPTTQNNYNYGNDKFPDPIHLNNNGFLGGRPPSSTPSSRSSTRSRSSSRSWGSQPPLTSSKRDQNWEKKRRQWLARHHSNNGSNYGDRVSNSSSAWSSGPAGGVLNDSINPPSPLSKFIHQQAEQQQQHQLPQTPGVDNQRLGTASSYMNHQPNPTPVQIRGMGYPRDGASLSRAGLSTASSTLSITSSRRQPPGGQCQWSLG
ncbi:hypothetical protein GN244_ATG15693 [Phytophthora infestans]|uniref:Uncharacterized protein n=1 Tax=Phytophthora infestans TaxID=4787 RepID=A0A833SLW1_PHYIN|nr:hypothetical protein GN244_ATG15693 [Phytophthora infestans]